MKYLLLFILFSNYSDSFCQNDSIPLIHKPNTAFVVYPDSLRIGTDSARLVTSYTRLHPISGNSINIKLYDNSSFEMNFSTDIPNFQVYLGQYEMSSDTLILNISFSLSESETCKKRYFKIGEHQLSSLANEKKNELFECTYNPTMLNESGEIFTRDSH